MPATECPTSIFVAALTAEAETARMQDWMAAQAPGDLVISPWVVTEFSAALSIKTRTGHLDPRHHAVVLAAFSRLVAESLTMVTVPEQAFRHAARLADRSGSGLRAGDALHLAIAAGEGLVLVTLDRRLAEAGAMLGAAAELL